MKQFVTQGTILLSLITIVSTSALPRSQANVSPRAYFVRAKVGLFVHYTVGSLQDGTYSGTWSEANGKPVTDINVLADGLDVNALTNLARATGAQYVIFTSYHAGMNLLYPSQVWGKVFPNKIAKRDLIGNLADALKAKGIPLVLYVHPDDRHDLTPAEQQKLVDSGYSTQINIRGEPDQRPIDPVWQATYVRIIDEIGIRYGSRIYGYWQDGPVCDGPKVKATMLRHTPDAAIWINGGSSSPPSTLIGSEGAHQQHQWAALVTGNWFASGGKITRTPREMYQTTVLWAATRGQTNGGISWSAGPYLNNQWETGVAEAFKQLGRLMRFNATAIYGTVASAAYITTPAARPKWGVATDSGNGRTVYAHVFTPPNEPLLEIGKPADGRVFGGATLLSNGKAMGFTTTENGYVLTLPMGEHWDDVDTVICLAVKK